MDMLNKRGIGFLVGTSNMLYIKNPPYSTAAVVEVSDAFFSLFFLYLFFFFFLFILFLFFFIIFSSFLP